MGSFPLFYNKIYRNVVNRIAKESAFTKSLFDKAVSAKIENMKNGSGDFHHFFYDTFVFSKIKQLMGGRIRFLISGGAPLS